MLFTLKFVLCTVVASLFAIQIGFSIAVDLALRSDADDSWTTFLKIDNMILNFVTYTFLVLMILYTIVFLVLVIRLQKSYPEYYQANKAKVR